MMAKFFGQAWTYLWVLALAAAGTASAGEQPDLARVDVAPVVAQTSSLHFYPQRAYLDDFPRPARIQDRRRIRLRYDRPLELGQTKIILRLKASPKPRKLVGVELRF